MHHLWPSGFKGEPPEAVSALVMGDQDAGVGDGGGADVGGDVGADGPPGSGQYGPVAGAEEKFTPEGSVSGSCLLF